MMKVNGKHPILGHPSSLTPGAIDLKFGTVDYVRGTTPHAKNCKNRPGGVAPTRVKYNVQRFFLFFLVSDFLPSSGEHIFGNIAVIFASNGVFQRGLIS